MSLIEDMRRYEQITGESAEHVPTIKVGAILDGYKKGWHDALRQEPDAIIRTIFGMIHYVCIKNRYCEDCPFLRGKCIIYDDSPNDWKMDLINEAIQELREKMEV